MPDTTAHPPIPKHHPRLTAKRATEIINDRYSSAIPQWIRGHIESLLLAVEETAKQKNEQSKIENA